MTTPTTIPRGEAVPARLAASRRIGKWVAYAPSRSDLDEFVLAAASSALRVMQQSVRVITIPHLANAVAQECSWKAKSTKPLIEGVVYQLLSEGRLHRITCFSRLHTTYQLVGLPTVVQSIKDIALDIYDAVCESQSLSASAAKPFVRTGFLNEKQCVQIAFGYLLYEGYVTADNAPGVAFEFIRLPHARPRF